MDAASPSMAARPASQHASVGTLAGALWRRKFWIIIPTLLAFLGSLVVVNVMRPRYTGEARILLENRETVYSRPGGDTRPESPLDPEAVASQVQNIMSKDLALKVIREMGLAKKEEFDSLANGLGMVRSVLVGLGIAPDPRKLPLEERVLETYLRRLLVFPQGKSRVLSLEFQSEDPLLAAEIANRIAEEYLKREQGAKSDTSKVTSEWLDKAIEPLMKKVLEAEGKVEAFRAKKGLFIGSNNMTITNQQLSDLNQQLSVARSQQVDLQARAKLIREAVRLGRVFETSEINNNDLVRRLLEQRAALKAQIAFEERTLLPGHPRMKELSSQLADLESQVRSAAERAARAFENDSRAAGARYESLQAEMNLQKKTATLSNEDEVQLKALERDAVALREQLVSYRNKFLDAAARGNDTPSPADARVISRAFPQNEPTFPKKGPIVLLATLATFVVACALITSSYLMSYQASLSRQDAYGYEMPPVPPYGGSGPFPGGPSGRAPFPWEAQPASSGGFQLPFGLGRKARHDPKFGAAPARAEAEHAEPFEQPEAYAPPAESMMHAGRSPLSEVAQQRTGVQAAEQIARELAMLGYLGRGKLLTVFGMDGHARTSLYSLQFGRRLAREGATIVLDLSGQSDVFTRILGTKEVGFDDYLDGAASIGDIIHRDPKTRMDVIPSFEPIQHRLFSPAARRALEELVDALMRSYANVVIDAGCTGGAGEIVADMADAFVLMTRRNDEHESVQTIAERLEGMRGSPVFVVQDDDFPGRGAANDLTGARHFGSA